MFVWTFKGVMEASMLVLVALFALAYGFLYLIDKIFNKTKKKK